MEEVQSIQFRSYEVAAAVRHRWNLDHGGNVEVLDLGFGVLTVPSGYTV
ncbi:MAG TPA: hypothetical protein VG298_15885 [Acidimicrobiales bacterium]|nr:hypothetical protein [Acidimicrobiales bacterium]